MTAEIAVLNKSAVALAADSAVTIGRGENSKIYNSVNKIFEMHNSEPVGIMIYNRLDYMGLPLETLIKQHRKTAQKRNSIEEYLSDFLAYLKDLIISDKDRERQVISLSYDILTELNRLIHESIMDNIYKMKKYLKSKNNAIASEVINKKLEDIKSYPFMNYADKAYVKKIHAEYGNIIDAVIVSTVKTLAPNRSTKESIRKLVVESFCRQVNSSYDTGIVVAGFGEKEICPSLVSVEIDGVICGELKILDGKNIKIEPGAIEADVVGFAQSDMIDRFMHGIDPEIDKYYRDIFDQTINQTARLVVAANSGLAAGTVTLTPDITLALEKIKKDQNNNLDNYKKKWHTRPVIDMIEHMPKQEIATLADALIEITVLKRHVSREQESVGGDVDMAVISKSEGFVWVKRKHYFPSEINPRFFANRYGNPGSRP